MSTLFVVDGYQYYVSEPWHIDIDGIERWTLIQPYAPTAQIVNAVVHGPIPEQAELVASISYPQPVTQPPSSPVAVPEPGYQTFTLLALIAGLAMRRLRGC